MPYSFAVLTQHYHHHHVSSPSLPISHIAAEETMIKHLQVVVQEDQHLLMHERKAVLLLI